MNIQRIFFCDRGWLDRPVASSQNVLDVGAGGIRRGANVVLMDMIPLPGTDVVHNVESHPWPFKDSQFDYIVMGNVLEHVEDLSRFMREVHRVARPGAMVRIVTPHFSNPCSFSDPTHKRAVALHVLDMFCTPVARSGPGKWIAKLLGCDISVGGQFLEGLYQYRRVSLYFRELMWLTLAPLWANVFQDFYETYFSRLIPAWAIYYELRVIKAS